MAEDDSRWIGFKEYLIVFDINLPQSDGANYILNTAAISSVSLNSWLYDTQCSEHAPFKNASHYEALNLFDECTWTNK